MIEESRLTNEELESIRHLVPAPEPPLELRIRRVPVEEERGRIIPVADTDLTGNEMEYLVQCVRTGWISSAGHFVRDFESMFARAVGCRYGVACANGTVALHLALVALGIGAGDEVIIPTFTMIATPNAVRYTGAHPVLVDAEPLTWNLDPAKLEACVTPRTKAIMVVHTYGHPVDMDAVHAVARRHRLHVVEDAAEAHGARYRDRPVGSLGDVACFSFYANKIITTGEGGMLTTDDERLARVARRLRDHAFSDERHFWHTYLGFNYRMTNLQAAIGVAQTERFADLVERRRANARRYTELLHDVKGLRLPVEAAWARNVFWMYGMVVEPEFGCARDVLRQRLAREGIETRTFFIPIHLQPIYFQTFKGRRFPVAESLGERGLYLPSGPRLTPSEIEYIADAVRRAQKGDGQ